MTTETKKDISKGDKIQSSVRKTGSVSTSNGMEAQIYNKEGKAIGKVQLPGAIFGLTWNGDLVHQVVVGTLANKRTSVAHTKDRGDVRGGGRKPWRQKGTGRARVGSIRSPLWRGGGVTFGPRKEKDYSKKINKKMKIKALNVALSQKLRDGEVLFVDKLSFAEPKTTKAKGVLTALSSVKGFSTLISKKKNSALIAMNEKNSVVKKSFNNIGSIKVDEIRNFNTYDVLTHKHIIIVGPEDAVTFLKKKAGLTSKDSEVKKEKVTKPVKRAAVRKMSPKKSVVIK